MKILDVDLIRYETGDATARRAVVDGVLRSLETGFVYLAHDVPSEELDTCYARLARFFALDTEQKMRSHAPGTRGQRGYTELLVETAAGRHEADWKEMLNWGEALPAAHPLARRFPDRYAASVFPEAEIPGIEALLMGFHRRIADLQRRFLRIVAEGLGAHAAYFDRMVEHGATLTRAVHYPPMAGAPSPDHCWAAAHGDINLVTALPRATAAGLQVQTSEGWIDVAPPEGSAVLNTGMMLEHVSNGLLPTGIHRVVAGTDPSEERISVVQFCHPTPSTILAPLASCTGPENPQRFGSISAADRLDEVLWEINLADGNGESNAPS